MRGGYIGACRGYEALRRGRDSSLRSGLRDRGSGLPHRCAHRFAMTGREPHPAPSEPPSPGGGGKAAPLRRFATPLPDVGRGKRCKTEFPRRGSLRRATARVAPTVRAQGGRIVPPPAGEDVAARQVREKNLCCSPLKMIRLSPLITLRCSHWRELPPLGKHCGRLCLPLRRGGGQLRRFALQKRLAPRGKMGYNTL